MSNELKHDIFKLFRTLKRCIHRQIARGAKLKNTEHLVMVLLEVFNYSTGPSLGEIMLGLS